MTTDLETHAAELASRLSSMHQFKPAGEELLLMLRREVRPETFRMQTRKVGSPSGIQSPLFPLTGCVILLVSQIVTLIEVRHASVWLRINRS